MLPAVLPGNISWWYYHLPGVGDSSPQNSRAEMNHRLPSLAKLEVKKMRPTLSSSVGLKGTLMLCSICGA